MANITLTNQTNSPVGIDRTHFGVNVPTSASLVGTDLQIAEVYRDAGLGKLVNGVPPVNTAGPVITGTPQVGQTLTTTNGTWSGSPTLVRQWQSSANGTTGWSNTGATGSTRAVVEGDLTRFFRVVVTGTTPAGTVNATSNVVGPVVA